jgi:pimeloyl-ACP methyl ester carboxylesterase
MNTMTDTLDQPQASTSADPAPGASPARSRRWRRVARASGIGVIGLVLLALVGALINVAAEAGERSALPAYGERVAVAGGHLNVYRHGQSGPTIVMLTGYGTAAPALDFAPLIRELEGFQVVVVEGFGYGYSDTDAPPRTVENIADELHQAVAALDLDERYILLGHSIAGIYELYYANRYPDEVSAVIGIDASVPGQMNGLAGQGSPWNRLVAVSGLLRAVTTAAPSLIEPGGTAYTPQEREQRRAMTKWNSANPAILDEANQGAHNFAVVQDMTYPDDVPVLSFIKKEGNQPGWRTLHQTQLANLDRGELVELDGGHYLHWTHSPQLAQHIRAFLGEVAGNQ